MKRRGSGVLPEAIFGRRGSGDSAAGAANNGSKDIDLERVLAVKRAESGRSGSIMTSKMIKEIKKNRKRIVAKGGQFNIDLINVEEKGLLFAKDIFNTVIDMQWRWGFIFSKMTLGTFSLILRC